MEKIKIDEWDRRTYYPMSFNEQMALIDEEVEYFINDREKTHKQLNEIRAMGKETYGTMKSRVTYGIHRLFERRISNPPASSVWSTKRWVRGMLMSVGVKSSH